MLENLTRKSQALIAGGIVAVLLIGLFIYEETKSSTPGGALQSPKTFAIEGIAAFKSGDLSLAKELFTQEIAASGSSNNAKSIGYYNLGTVVIRQNGVKAGIKYYQEAVAINRYFALAWLNLGVAEGSLKNGPAALTAYNSLLKLQPTNVDGLFNSGIILYDTGQKALGIQRLKKAIDLKPSLVESLPKNINLT